MSRRANAIAVVVFVVALLLLLFALSPRNRRSLQSGFLNLISPFLKTGSNWDSEYRKYRGQVKKLEELEKELAAVKIENDRFRLENTELVQLKEENARLREAAHFQQHTNLKTVPARVIGRQVSNWWHTIKVDKGTAEGVTTDMAVVTAKGLVGKIILPGAHDAMVLLITDELCRVPARVENSEDDGRQGIVHVEVRGERSASNQQPQMKLRFLSKNASLKKDDRIVTSAASQIYPAGVTVGKVVDFKSRELDGEATVEPEVDLAALTDVFIVTEDKTSKPPQ